uniref:Putative secreted protein n=1 Tax=Ixodes ricinus TaxID=34613 RepID=A0A6B0V3H4_IXORI
MHARCRFALAPLCAAIALRCHRSTPMPPSLYAASPYAAHTAIALRRHRLRRHCFAPPSLAPPPSLMLPPSLTPPPPQTTAVARLGCALPPPPPPQSSARAASNPRRDPPRVAARIPEVRADSPATRCRQQSPGFAPPLRPGRVVVVVLEDVVELALCLLAGVSGRPKKWPTKVGGGALGFKGGTENQGAVCYPATIRCAAAAAAAALWRFEPGPLCPLASARGVALLWSLTA